MPPNRHEREEGHIAHKGEAKGTLTQCHLTAMRREGGHIAHKGEAKRCALCGCDMGEGAQERRPISLGRGINISQNVIPLCLTCQGIVAKFEKFVAKRYSELEKQGIRPLHMIVAGVALLAVPEAVASTVVGITLVTAGIRKMRKSKKESRGPRLVFEDHLQLGITKALTDGEAREIIKKWIELRYPLFGGSVDFQVRYQSQAA